MMHVRNVGPETRISDHGWCMMRWGGLCKMMTSLLMKCMICVEFINGHVIWSVSLIVVLDVSYKEEIVGERWK